MKMKVNCKPLLFVIVALLFVVPVFAAYQNLRYGIVNHQDVGWDVLYLSDGSFLYSGMSRHLPPDSAATSYITRGFINGSVFWTQLIGGPSDSTAYSYDQSAVQVANGNLVMCTAQPLDTTYKRNYILNVEDGSTITTFEDGIVDPLLGSTHHCREIVVAADGDVVYLMSNVSEDWPVIVKYNTVTATEKWRFEYQGVITSTYRPMALTSSGDVAFLIKHPDPSNEVEIVLLDVDDGSLKDSFLTGEDFYPSSITKSHFSDRLLLSGSNVSNFSYDGVVLETDLNSVIWKTVFGGVGAKDSSYDRLYGIADSTVGYIAVGTTYSVNPEGEIWIVKFGYYGNLIEEEIYGDTPFAVGNQYGAFDVKTYVSGGLRRYVLIGTMSLLGEDDIIVMDNDYAVNSPTVCGDGIVDVDEVCDGSNLSVGEQVSTCVSEGYTSGSLACLGDCSNYNYAGCTTSTCGNGVKESGEACDGSDFGSTTCISFGKSGGDLSCTGSCSIDTSGCTSGGGGGGGGEDGIDSEISGEIQVIPVAQAVERIKKEELQLSCGDKICDEHAGENFFTCWTDCATLARLNSGELWKDAMIFKFFLYLGLIIVLALAISEREYRRLGSKIRRRFD